MTNLFSDASAAQYLQILNTTPDAMVLVDETSTLVFVNDQAENLFGYKRELLLGRPLELLIPQRFHRTHSGHVARYFSNPTTRPMGGGVELFGTRSDGREIAVEVSLSPVQVGETQLVAASIRDVSTRKQLESMAKLNADRLTSAVDSIQDAFALFDSGDRLVLCNSAYRQIKGQSHRGPIIGKSYPDLLDMWLPELDLPNELSRSLFRERRLRNRNEGGTVDIRTLDGRALRLSDRRTPEGGVVTTIWDLTEDQKRAEELRVAHALAEAGSKAKSEFLSSVSHELRTPLNAILGFAQLLERDRKEPLSARQHERVEQILRGGEHLLRLINDVLDLSRIESGNVSISSEPVSVLEVLHEVKNTLDPAAARAGVSLNVDVQQPQLPPICVDRTRFAQILMNFGSNAIKYNRPAGSVTLRVSVPSPDYVRLTVVDTGLGVPEEHQGKLFQPFHRAGQESGPIEGTGIGLAITKRLAELMNGRVGFESHAGEGSQFWVEMPVDESAHKQVEPAAPVVSAPGLEERRGHVLYVEDNPANVRLLRDLLSQFEGIELVTAPTAELGLELARANPPDVIILDINLPGMSGLDALHQLQQWPETVSVPVIALTAAASDRDKQRGEKAGFYRYLTKPVRIDELESALEPLLKMRP